MELVALASCWALTVRTIIDYPPVIVLAALRAYSLRLHVKIAMLPVMNADDLKKGLDIARQAM